MLGLLPLDGGGIVRLALPMFETMAVCGLSVESDVPTVVGVGYVKSRLAQINLADAVIAIGPR